jgi:cytochrome P450
MSAPSPPSWRTWHPLGHVPGFLADPVGLFTSARERHGDIVGMRLFHRRALLVSDPASVQRILVGHARNYRKTTPGYRVLRILLGEGLVTAEGEDWKRKRRIANPAFHRRCLEGFVKQMDAAAAAACEGYAGDGEGPRDLAVDMQRLTLQIAGETLFHVDLSADSDEVAAAVRVALDGFNQLVSSPVPFAHKLPTERGRRMRGAVADLDRVVHGIIQSRRAAPEPVSDLLGMLMATEDDETGTVLTDAELRDEVVTMLLAGHETTANALAWTLWLLGKHPEIAAAAAAEVDAVCPSGPVGFGILPELPLLRRIFLESIRVYPPVWLIAREAVEDDVLGGFRVHAGTWVFLSPYVQHRHPGLWPDPDRFDPDRFLPDASAGRAPGVYIPFSTGARKCIGDRFAEAEALVVLVHMLRRFRVELEPRSVPTPEIVASVTLRPKSGIHGRLRARAGAAPAQG